MKKLKILKPLFISIIVFFTVYSVGITAVSVPNGTLFLCLLPQAPSEGITATENSLTGFRVAQSSFINSKTNTYVVALAFLCEQSSCVVPGSSSTALSVCNALGYQTGVSIPPTTPR